MNLIKYIVPQNFQKFSNLNSYLNYTSPSKITKSIINSKFNELTSFFIFPMGWNRSDANSRSGQEGIGEARRKFNRVPLELAYCEWQGASNDFSVNPALDVSFW